jgi:hypothetical protein
VEKSKGCTGIHSGLKLADLSGGTVKDIQVQSSYSLTLTIFINIFGRKFGRMKKILCMAGVMATLLYSCSSNNTATHTQDNSNDSLQNAALDAAEQMNTAMKAIETKGGVTLTDWIKSPDFPEAKLSIAAPADGSKVNEGKVMFQYKVENFELTKPTDGSGTCNCANSAQGQHIHQILNNEPYSALYADTFSKMLKPGHYVNLSFLSRSYHESIKHNDAYVLTQFDVGKPAGNTDLTKPMLFYSRPKGEYKGMDTANILLDFYLVNTDLSAGGNKVRATINGNEFMLNTWKPYGLQGLHQGENTIKLELVDAQGSVIPGPFNSVTRTITLKP